jgi:DNA polymerase III sliding clamp (beta) subunit (PCNA family)
MNPITIPMTELKPALAGLSKIIPKRATLPVLGCVRIGRTDTGHVELSGTDLDHSATVRLQTPAQGDPQTILVRIEDLRNAAKSADRDSSLIIRSSGKETIALKFPVGGNIIEQQCPAIAPDEFPPIKEISGEPAILDERLRLSIREALECASTDTTRLILNSAYIDVSKPGAHHVIGTDGRHLYSSNSFALSLKESAVVPSHRFLASKEFHNDGDWKLRVATPEKNVATHLEIASDNWRFATRVIDGIYPNWRQVVPDTGSFRTKLDINPNAVDDLIKTIARLPDHDPVNHTIGLESAGTVSLLAKTSGAENWTPVNASGITTTGKDVKVFLNRRFFMKALRFGLTRIDIIDPLAPLRFSSGGRQMVVMPIRPDSPTVATGAASPAPAVSTASQPAESNKGAPKPAPNDKPTTADPQASPDAEQKSALETAVSQLDALKAAFREALTGVTKVADLLKQAVRDQKSSDKEVQSVRQTLRSLQSVRL